MSKKIIAVFGATGNQGSSVITHILTNPHLSSTYNIRALTRNPSSPSAQNLLSQGIEVVHADFSKRPTLESALRGVHTVFLMNPPIFGPGGFEAEYSMITSVADVAVAVGCSYLIFSTLPSISEMSAGKFTSLSMFDAKAAGEQYIRGLEIKSAFVALGFFMENWHAQTFLGPQKVEVEGKNGEGDGEGGKEKWVLKRPAHKEVRIPYIDAVADTGKYVAAILLSPDTFIGQTIYAAEGMYTYTDTVEAMSKASGKKVVYEQVDAQQFRDSLAQLPDGAMKDLFVDAMVAQGELGVFGEGTEGKIVEGRKVVVGWGWLVGLGEYFEREGFVLE